MSSRGQRLKRASLRISEYVFGVNATGARADDKLQISFITVATLAVALTQRLSARRAEGI